jgi:hypothetical protein
MLKVVPDLNTKSHHSLTPEQRNFATKNQAQFFKLFQPRMWSLIPNPGYGHITNELNSCIQLFTLVQSNLDLVRALVIEDDSWWKIHEVFPKHLNLHVFRAKNTIMELIQRYKGDLNAVDIEASSNNPLQYLARGKGSNTFGHTFDLYMNSKFFPRLARIEAMERVSYGDKHYEDADLALSDNPQDDQIRELIQGIIDNKEQLRKIRLELRQSSKKLISKN